MTKQNQVKKPPHKMIFALTVIVCCLIACLLGYYQMNQSKIILEKTFSKSEKTIANPLMGFAPQASDQVVSDDIELVYIDLYWSELEPKEGQFNWQDIEKEEQFERWRSEGKHAILRFVSDYPTNKDHLDIPQWLYDKTKDGRHYKNDYGKGYSPNYKNPILVAAFQKAVAAMGQRWGRDGFITYIELGGLGHWGEWHTSFEPNSTGSMPKEAIRNRYVSPWSTAFPTAKLLMRRPFKIAAEQGMGLFNDVTGDEDETDTWFQWIKEGGNYEQTGEKAALSAMPTYWKTAPSGGELTSAKSMYELMVADFATTKRLLRQAHTTFLGPKIADKSVSSSAYDKLLKNMGYRLWLSKVQINHQRNLSLTWENDGVAPFYWKWPVMIYITSNGKTEAIKTHFDLTQVQPGISKQLSLKLSSKQFQEWQKISLAVLDPMTNKPALRFAIKGHEEDKILTLLSR